MTTTTTTSSSIHFSNIPKKRSSTPWTPDETELLKQKTGGRKMISAKEARELQSQFFPNRTFGAIERKVKSVFRKEHKYGDTVQLSDYMDPYSDEDWNESLEYNDNESKEDEQQEQQEQPVSVYYPTVQVPLPSIPLLSLSLPPSPAKTVPISIFLPLPEPAPQQQQTTENEEEDDDEVLKAYKEFKRKGRDRESKLKEIDAKRMKIEPEFLKLQEQMKELEENTQKLKQEAEDDNSKMIKVKELLF